LEIMERHIPTAAVSPALMAQLQDAAEKEHRSPDELVRDAVEQYLAHRQWQHVMLSCEDSILVANALLNPPEPTPALQRAAQHRRDLLGQE
jgi:uncharacterized protein (DUF1778 family)